MKWQHILLVVALSPGLGRAQFAYTTNNGTLTITRYTGGGGPVVIPDQVDSMPVVAIGSGAWVRSSSPTEITLGANLATIGSGALADCLALTNIVFADSLTNIGDAAFSGCRKLRTLALPDSLISLGTSAFLRCTNLEWASIGTNLSTIGVQPFAGCHRLGSITVHPFNPVFTRVALIAT